jgi:hypothetical protein
MRELIDNLNYGLAAFGVQIPSGVSLDERLQSLTERPATNAAIVVVAGGLLMHHFEKGHNPRIKDVYDAMLYCATSLSVGYAESHPVTPAGKLLASVLHTYGPALAAKTLDGPSGEGRNALSGLLSAIVGKMQTEASRTAVG